LHEKALRLFAVEGEERTGIFPSVSMTRAKWTRHGKRDFIQDEGDVGRHQRFCGGCPFLLCLVVIIRSVLSGDSYLVDLNPAKGREQAGPRYVIIVSPREFSRPPRVCPTTQGGNSPATVIPERRHALQRSA
jgi:hypothetical protein